MLINFVPNENKENSFVLISNDTSANRALHRNFGSVLVERLSHQLILAVKHFLTNLEMIISIMHTMMKGFFDTDYFSL